MIFKRDTIPIVSHLVLDEPPSQNQTYAPGKRGLYKTQIAKNWQTYAGLQANLCIELEPIESRYMVVLDYYPNRDNRDLDNVCKLTLDAFNNIAYPDDKMVRVLMAEKHDADKDNPRLVVSIYRFVKE
jgi:Holliday junction resolvase RusA-like endonuclease